MNINSIAKEVFEIESQAISNLSKKLTSDFESVINLVLNSNGKLIVSGMGKSGHIGKKIAATLASTGTPSFFIHPAEAFHGDLGMVEKNDIVLLISNSGETDEILKLIPFFKNQKNSIISMTGNKHSTLANNTNFHLNISVEIEACHLQLAPTSSTTATLVMGDALAISLMKIRGFKANNFAKFHPGGSLGKRLLYTVENIMIKDDLPKILENESIQCIISEISKGKCGLVIVENKNKKIIGVISDGDIRRAMEINQENFFNLKACDLMTVNPKIVHLNTKLNEANEILNREKISSLIVVDDNQKLAGIVQSFQINS